MENRKIKLAVLLFFSVLLIVSIPVLITLFAQKNNPTKLQPYTINYNTTEGGHLDGDITQYAYAGKSTSEIKAIPDERYLFAGWSDNVLTNPRVDTNISSNISVTANFIYKSKTLKYDYNNATQNNDIPMITLDYDYIFEANFIIPQKIGYEFNGWYLDKELTKRVTDQNGNYFLGYSIFFSNADTLYARWDQNTEAPIYPILMVFVDEIQANLINNKNETVEVDYKMLLLEMKICELIPPLISRYINEWFDGKIYFEVDSYFTTMPLDSNSFQLFYSDSPIYRITGKLKETDLLVQKYKSVITTSCLNNQINEINMFAGIAETKYAYISYNAFENSNIPLNNFSIDINIIDSYFHEFTHTIEAAYEGYLRNISVSDGLDFTFIEYHDVAVYYSNKYHELNFAGEIDHASINLIAEKAYLMNAAEYYDKTVGIPIGFWLDYIYDLIYIPGIID